MFSKDENGMIRILHDAQPLPLLTSSSVHQMEPKGRQYGRGFNYSLAYWQRKLSCAGFYILIIQFQNYISRKGVGEWYPKHRHVRSFFYDTGTYTLTAFASSTKNRLKSFASHAVWFKLFCECNMEILTIPVSVMNMLKCLIFNTFRSEQNGCKFADGIVKCISF